MRYTVLRDGAELSLIAIPRETVVSNEEFKVKEKVGQVGLGLAHDNLHNVRLNPIEAAGYGLSQTGECARSHGHRPAAPCHRQGRLGQAVRPARHRFDRRSR